MNNRPQQNHVRAQSQGRKSHPPHVRPSRPTPMKRGSSYSHPHPPSSNTQGHSSNRASWSGGKKPKIDGELQYVEEEEGGMASFPQFCATCEKQIVTPGTSILYCSEACRKQDVSRPVSLESMDSIRWSTSPYKPSYHDYPPVDIVPQRSPTVLRPISMCSSDLSLSDMDDLGDRWSRRDSAYDRYLDPFDLDYLNTQYSHQPRTNPASAAVDSSNTPSLVHSLSSSYGTNASYASYRPRQLALPLPTADRSTSPTRLPQDASLESSVSTLTSLHATDTSTASSHNKRTSSSRKSSSSSHTSHKNHSSNDNDEADKTSLKSLFRHDAMKAPPKSDHKKSSRPLFTL